MTIPRGSVAGSGGSGSRLLQGTAASRARSGEGVQSRERGKGKMDPTQIKKKGGAGAKGGMRREGSSQSQSDNEEQSGCIENAPGMEAVDGGEKTEVLQEEVPYGEETSEEALVTNKVQPIETPHSPPERLELEHSQPPTSSSSGSDEVGQIAEEIKHTQIDTAHDEAREELDRGEKGIERVEGDENDREEIGEIPDA
jgi:hypothetical protein